jgi:pimeloyl-ACP methyl ester carboxylesterase
MTSANTASLFRAPPIGLLLTEPWRAALEFAIAKLRSPPAVRGDGHPVVVYPGLGGGAMTTSHLRGFLAECGFTVHDWEMGVNTGPDGDFDAWLPTLAERVQELKRSHGRTVSLVGWSLGGVYAREVARACPEAVRQVVTLGTPFHSLGGANHAGTIYKLLGGDTSQLTPELQARLSAGPPVPTTSVYSRTDGVVCWRGCVQQRGARLENVEVQASHLGMGTHAEVLRIVADRLAQPEGGWRPYRRPRVRRLKASTAPSPSMK